MAIKALEVEKLRRIISPKEVMPNLKEYSSIPIFIGRDRAQKALEFGLGIDEGHFHLFVLGPPGVGKKTTILELLKEKARKEKTPDDWCYVYNFQDDTRPQSLSLPSGRGAELKKAMEYFTSEAKLRIGRAYESEEYSRRRQSIEDEASGKRKENIQSLERKAKEYNYQVVETPFGIAFVPVIAGQPLTEAQVEVLDESTKKHLQAGREELARLASSLGPKLRKIEREAGERYEDLNKEIIDLTISPLVDELKGQFGQLTKVLEYIERVKKDIVEHANRIKEEIQEPTTESTLKSLLLGDRGLTSHFNRYEVNLFISHSNNGAPVVTENLPTVPRVIGHYEFKPRLGSLTTDYTLIKSGALHKANGGYLVLDALEVLTQPFAWEVLKSVLESRCIRIEDAAERLPFSLPTPTLRPEPIPLEAKIILVGQPHVYYLLAQLDKDFLELFKVKVDFDTDVKMDQESLERFAAFVHYFCQNELKTEIEPSGIARLAEEASRLAEHQDRLALHYRNLTDLLREAKYWANKRKDKISQEDVKKAINEKIYRSNLVEEKIREMIDEDTIFINTTGEKVGQVNGVSVLQLGDYQFGKPTRITARTFVGKEGVINIERKTDLSGPIHGKAVMILANYLGGKFAQKVPLAISASLTFEQEYSMIEGDSATLSELCALLSGLSDVPVRQDLVITGSVNQYGQVQPVGGINDKIEGFFMVCKEKGGVQNQGALIPEANTKHLMLNEEVVEAVRDKKFNVFAVKTVDEAMELLTGKPISEIDKKIEERLLDYAKQWKRFMQHKEEY